MIIRGGAPLRGTVELSGSKNAALPCLMAALLTDEPVLVHNVPRLRDVRTSMDLLGRLGVASRWVGDHDVELHARAITSHEAPYELVKTMRASFLVLGPLLARTGRARVSTPGGCAIGARPVNLHIAGMRMFGARIQMRHGYVEAHAGLSPRRARVARLALGRRHREHHDGRGARARPHFDRERGARARGAGPRADTDRDGRANLRRRQPRDRNRRRRASAAVPSIP